MVNPGPTMDRPILDIAARKYACFLDASRKSKYSERKFRAFPLGTSTLLSRPVIPFVRADCLLSAVSLTVYTLVLWIITYTTSGIPGI